MSQVEIPGYTYGQPSVQPSPVSMEDLERIQACLLWSDEDVQALRRAGEILGPRKEEILDVWYGFVASQPHLLAYFSRPDGPSQEYLQRVRARFGRWIEDTCRAEYDQRWLDYQEEIAQRHFTRKNQTDGAAAEGTPPYIHWRYINALVYPIYATVRPFLEQGGEPPEMVEKMHQAWLKAVLLQATLWARPYAKNEAW